MNIELKQVAVAGSVCAIAAMFAACGGGGDGGSVAPAQLQVPYAGKTTQAPLTAIMTNITSADNGQSFCTATAGTASKLLATADVAKMAKVVTTKQLAKATFMTLPYFPTSSYNPYAQPVAGSCGGTLQYNNFSHLSGTTRATIVYDNYCNYDNYGTSGPSNTINGSVNYVANGTPSDAGPVVSSYTGDIPKLTVTEKDASGVITDKTSVAATGFTLVPTTTRDTITLTQATMSDDLKNKTTMLTGVTVVSTTSGTVESETITGRLYMGDQGFVDITTKTPITIDASGNYTGGVLTVTGADGAKDLTIDTTATAGPVFTIQGTTAKLNCSGI